MKHYITSNCCGAPITNTDYDICPDCLEHCVFEEFEEEEEQEVKSATSIDSLVETISSILFDGKEIPKLAAYIESIRKLHKSELVSAYCEGHYANIVATKGDKPKFLNATDYISKKYK